MANLTRRASLIGLGAGSATFLGLVPHMARAFQLREADGPTQSLYDTACSFRPEPHEQHEAEVLRTLEEAGISMTDAVSDSDRAERDATLALLACPICGCRLG